MNTSWTTGNPCISSLLTSRPRARHSRGMLTGTIFLALLRGIPISHLDSRINGLLSAAPTFCPRVLVMPSSRKRNKPARRAEAGANPAARVNDIEELPSGLAASYRQHDDSYHAFNSEEVIAVRHELLSWYETNRRMLPWRGDPPPWTKTADVLLKKDAGSSSSRVRKVDAAQPLLTAFFGGRERTAGATGTGVARKRNTVNGGPDERGRAEGLSAEGAGHSERQHAERIPVRDAAKRAYAVRGVLDAFRGFVSGQTSAYGTWVSEVMLQQTRVETVVDYYVKWMALFPTPEALAEADLEQVNNAWAGLGYYRRAKMLHEGAKKVQSEYGGSLPGTAKELKELPGIGPYTAGAVASIAFGEREPLVDGNVIRVLSRLRAVASDPKNAGLNKLCWDLATTIVDPERPGDFNQALMELGATVCTVKSPSCSTCPLRSSCLARKLAEAYEEPKAGEGSGDIEHGSSGGKSLRSASQEPPAPGRKCDCAVCEVQSDGMAVMPLAVTEYPRKAAKTAVKEQALSVTVVERGSATGPQVLLVKRPETGLLAGQWECPSVVLRDGSEFSNGGKGGKAGAKGVTVLDMSVPEEERRGAADTLLFSQLGLSSDLVYGRASVGSVVHVFSHLRHSMQVERVRLADDPNIGLNIATPSDREIRWVDVKDMGGVGITTGMKKVLALASKARLADTCDGTGISRDSMHAGSPCALPAGKTTSVGIAPAPRKKRPKHAVPPSNTTEVVAGGGSTPTKGARAAHRGRGDASTRTRKTHVAERCSGTGGHANDVDRPGRGRKQGRADVCTEMRPKRKKGGGGA